ncbi:MAG TPA: hypothetical protein VLF61_04000 [Rhabdochlamydiaceae bacterium]|nr:hypothetical protein [Rhabdochlamydiaceae bacterium]
MEIQARTVLFPEIVVPVVTPVHLVSLVFKHLSDVVHRILKNIEEDTQNNIQCHREERPLREIQIEAILSELHKFIESIPQKSYK